MVVGVGFCKMKVDSKFPIVLKIKCTKFHQDRSKTVDLHTKFINRHSVLYICIDKARPLLTVIKGCTKCCLATFHQLFQKVKRSNF
jgi:hypothetical protein